MRRLCGCRIDAPGVDRHRAHDALFPILALHGLVEPQRPEYSAARHAWTSRSLSNYGKILRSLDFQRALTQTTGLVASSLVLELIIGMAVALAQAPWSQGYTHLPRYRRHAVDGRARSGRPRLALRLR